MELNLEWIRTYFRVETKDEEQLRNPARIINEGGQILIAVGNGVAVGVCALIKMNHDTFELAKMAVSPKSRGRGIGDVLMVEAIASARELGATKLYLISNTSLSPAIQLYKKHGFIVTRLGQHPDYERGDIEMEKSLVGINPS